MENVEIIDQYTRAQAIEDGVLVDVSETAREAGFSVPVAVTRTLWEKWIVPDEYLKGYGQSTEGRLWDVLWLLPCAIHKARGVKGPLRELTYTVIFTAKPKRCHYEAGKWVTDHPIQKRVILKSVCHPGDDGEPVLTIMLPEED